MRDYASLSGWNAVQSTLRTTASRYEGWSISRSSDILICFVQTRVRKLLPEFHLRFPVDVLWTQHAEEGTLEEIRQIVHEPAAVTKQNNLCDDCKGYIRHRRFRMASVLYSKD